METEIGNFIQIIRFNTQTKINKNIQFQTKTLKNLQHQTHSKCFNILISIAIQENKRGNLLGLDGVTISYIRDNTNCTIRLRKDNILTIQSEYYDNINNAVKMIEKIIHRSLSRNHNQYIPPISFITSFIPSPFNLPFFIHPQSGVLQ